MRSFIFMDRTARRSKRLLPLEFAGARDVDPIRLRAASKKSMSDGDYDTVAFVRPLESEAANGVVTPLRRCGFGA